MVDTENIMKSMMNMLYTFLTDGEAGFVERNEQERFIAWCLPGIPIEPSELRFLRRGFQGEGDTAEKKAEDTAQLIAQASRFSRLIDFVPEMTGIFDDKQQLVAFSRTESSLSRIYERVLKQSQVAAIELTEGEKKQIEIGRNLLYPEQEVDDVDSGNKVKRRVEGQLLRDYKRFSQAYEDAVFAWNIIRIRAQNPTTPDDNLAATFNLPTLRNRVSQALSDWEVNGRKSEIEGLQARISGITNRDLSLWKADLLDRFEVSRLADSLGQDFLFTSLVPAGFAFSDQGWPTFKITEKDVSNYSKFKSNQYGAGGKLGIGMFSIGGGASSTTSSKLEIANVTNFEAEFSITQIPIVRAWFDPTFLESRAWRLAPSAMELTFLSDGGNPGKDIAPKGMLAAYSTDIIFVRDMRFNCNEMHDEKSELHKLLKANGSGSWGLFANFGGSYTRDKTEKKVEYSFDEEGVHVKGLQILGFRCHLLKKSPNPSPNIKDFI